MLRTKCRTNTCTLHNITCIRHVTKIGVETDLPVSHGRFPYLFIDACIESHHSLCNVICMCEESLGYYDPS